MFKFVSLLQKSKTHKVRKAVANLSTPNIRRRWNNLSDITPTEREELLHGNWRNALPVQITRDAADRDYLYFVKERQQQEQEIEHVNQHKDEEEESDKDNKISPGVLSFASEEAAMEYIMRSEDDHNDQGDATNVETSEKDSIATSSQDKIPTLQSAREFFDNLVCSANDEVDIDEHALSENVPPYMSDMERREEERDVNRHFFADYYIQQGVITLSINNNEWREVDDEVVYRFIDAMMRPAHGLFWINCQYPLVRLTVQHQLEQHCKHLHLLEEKKEHYNNSSSLEYEKSNFARQDQVKVAPVVFTPSLLHPLLFVIEKMPEQQLGEVPRQVYSAECSIIAQRERVELNLESTSNMITESENENKNSEKLLLCDKEKIESLPLEPLALEQQEEAVQVSARENNHSKEDYDNDDKISSVAYERQNFDEASMLSLMLEEKEDTETNEDKNILQMQSESTKFTNNGNVLQTHDANNTVMHSQKDDSRVCSPFLQKNANNTLQSSNNNNENNNKSLELSVALQEHSCTPSLSHLYWLQRQVASNSISNVNELSVLISIIAVRCALANGLSYYTEEHNTVESTNGSITRVSSQHNTHYPIIVDLYSASQYNKSFNVKFSGYYMDIVQYIHYIQNECTESTNNNNNNNNSHESNTSITSKALNRVNNNNITLAVMLSLEKSFRVQHKKMKRQRALEKRLHRRSSASKRFDREERKSGADSLSLFDCQSNNRANKSINKNHDIVDNDNFIEESKKTLYSHNNNFSIPVSEQDVHLIYLYSDVFQKKDWHAKVNNKENSPSEKERRRMRRNNYETMCISLVDRCDVVLCTPPTSDDGVRPRILLDVNNSNVNKQEEESDTNNNRRITFHNNSSIVRDAEPIVNKFVHVCKNATRNFTRLCAQLCHAIEYAYANCVNESFEGLFTKSTHCCTNYEINNEEQQQQDRNKRFGWVVYATHSLNPVENEAVVCATLTQLRREQQEQKEELEEDEKEFNEELYKSEQEQKNASANMNVHVKPHCSVECVSLNAPELLSLCTAEEQSTMVEYMKRGTSGLSTWSSVEGVAREHEVDQCDVDIVESVASAAWRSNVLKENADGCFIVVLRVSKSVFHCNNNDNNIDICKSCNNASERDKLHAKLNDSLILSYNHSNTPNNKSNVAINKEIIYSVMTPAVYWWCQQIVMSANPSSSISYNDDEDINNELRISNTIINSGSISNNSSEIVCAGVPVGYISSSLNTSFSNTLTLLSSISNPHITEALIRYNNLCLVERKKKGKTEKEAKMEKATVNKMMNNTINLHLEPCSISCVMLAELLRIKTIHSKSLQEYLSILQEQQTQLQILMSNATEKEHIRAEREEHCYFYYQIMHEVELFMRSIRSCIQEYYMASSNCSSTESSKESELPHTFNVCFTPVILSEYLVQQSINQSKNKKTSLSTSIELHPLISEELSSVHIIATVTVHHRKHYKNEHSVSALQLEKVPFTVTLLHASHSITNVSEFNEEVEEMSVRVRDALLYVLHKIGYTISRRSDNNIAFLPKSVTSLQFTQTTPEMMSRRHEMHFVEQHQAKNNKINKNEHESEKKYEYQNRSTFSSRLSSRNYDIVEDEDTNDDYDVLPTSSLQQQVQQHTTTGQSPFNKSTPFAWEGMLGSNMLASGHGAKLRKLESKLKKAGVALHTPQNWVEQLSFLHRKHENQ